MKPEAVIYTDGSSGKAKDGGWAALVFLQSGSLIELVGFATDTTNNRMEMQAAIEGLKQLTEAHKVTLVSDSGYLINSLKHKWYEDWFRQEKNPFLKPRPNLDLWHELVDLCAKHEMIYLRIDGHTDTRKSATKYEWNIKADKLAKEARTQKLSYVREEKL